LLFFSVIFSLFTIRVMDPRLSKMVQAAGMPEAEAVGLKGQSPAGWFARPNDR
jgi:hypothetical protein